MKYFRLRLVPSALILPALLGGAACSGSVTEGDPKNREKPPALSPEGEPSQEQLARCRQMGEDDAQSFAGPPVLKRLARDQYVNAMQDIAKKADLALVTHPDPAADGNATLPAGLRVTRQVMVDTEANAWTAAGVVLERLKSAIGCAPAEGGTCLDAALDRLALWFHRRPLSDDMRTRYRTLFDTVKEAAPEDAALAVVAAFSQSPQFLYVWDAAEGENVAEGVRALDARQWADALALFLWRSVPDETLLMRAQEGTLDEPDARREEVARLLDDPRAQRSTDHFVGQWLMLGGLTGKRKEEPEWTAALGAEFRTDTDKVFASLMTGPDARFADLFTHHTAWVTKDNAKLLGRDEATAGTGAFVELGAVQRMGLLTHNSYLAAHSKLKGSSPILRGATFNKQVLCMEVPAPPDDLDIPPEPEHSAGTSAREQLAEHMQNPICAGCHMYIDPPGLALEHWDGLGRYRESEDGASIDPSGEVLLGADQEPQSFSTPAELFALVGEAPVAKHCFVSRWAAQSWGKLPTRGSEHCAVENIDGAAAGGEHNLRQTLESLALHPSFTFRTEVQSQ